MCQAYRTDSNTKGIDTPTDHEFYWTNSIVPMINRKYIEIRSNFNMEGKKEYLGEFHIKYIGVD